MLEAETLKADIDAVEKHEQQLKFKALVDAKTAEKSKRDELVSALGKEPTSGDIINVAIRLPNGGRLMRNFNQSDPIKVDSFHKLILGFIFSKESFPLENRLDLLYDYPPVKIKEEDYEKTFAEFFSNSDRQLITVNEEEL